MAKQLLIVLLVIFVASSNANDWCGITCKNYWTGGVDQHTMCKYKSNDPAPRCGKTFQVGVDQSQHDEILNFHNELRRNDANLPPLVWDKTLEAVAQRWVNQCNTGMNAHDTCRNLENEYVGQNFAWAAQSDKNIPIRPMMQGWANEKRYINSNILASYRQSQPTVGHYTQMVWAKTTKIGCGYVQTTDNRYGYAAFLICNYGPGGNIKGEPVY